MKAIMAFDYRLRNEVTVTEPFSFNANRSTVLRELCFCGEQCLELAARQDE